ncbi:MAG TPA: hypothetical protein VFM02_03285 [Candidatus Paceibacterota bacterium]|nr:hypothetical protein [Candidatus Paceibacterota bacterium]
MEKFESEPSQRNQEGEKKPEVFKKPEEVSKSEEMKQFIEAAKNLDVVFSVGRNSPNTPDYYVRLLDDQEHLIKDYLNPYKNKKLPKYELAPGLAVIGARMAGSGFGFEKPDTGDAELDKEVKTKAMEDYRASEDLFNKMVTKMYPDGLPDQSVLQHKLNAPLSELGESPFLLFKKDFQFLKEIGSDNREEYQSVIDGMISRAGGMMRNAAEAVYRFEDEYSPSQRRGQNEDIMVMAEALAEFQRLRKESIADESYFADKSPIQIKEFEERRRELQKMNVR